MGHTIETYSLSELKKISSPGKVVPSIFWAIPVGRWEYNNIERLWEFFTSDRINYCNKYGLLLVKNIRERQGNSSKTDLSNLSAKIEELLPGGNVTNYDVTSCNSQQLLILSGSYPQPGWGLLIEIEQFNNLENIISHTIKATFNENELNLYNETTNLYYRWREIVSKKPILPIIDNLDKSSILLNELLKEITEFLKQDKSNEYNKNSLNKIVKLFRDNPSLKYSDEYSLICTYDNDLLVIALAIKGMNNTYESNILNDKINDFIKNHDPYNNNYFKSETNDSLKKILSAINRNLNKLDNIEDFVNWPDNIYNNYICDIINYLKNLSVNLIMDLKKNEIERNEILQTHQENYKKWKVINEESRIKFDKKLKELLMIHSQLSSKFLLKLELTQNNTKQVLSWDPTRMVGWKLFQHLSERRFNLIDLVSTITELYPDLTIDSNHEIHTIIVNGSLFTDYVHYIAKSKPSNNPRDIVIELIKALLNQSDINSIISNYESGFISTDKTSSVEKLLTYFGWKSENNRKEITLAECIVMNDGKECLKDNLTGNDLRIIIESFIKDLIYTLIYKSKIEDDTTFWNVIFNYKEDYRKTHSWWKDEINQLMIGSGLIIIKALLNYIEYEKLDIVESFMKYLAKFSDLNKLSHHNPQGIELSEFIDPIMKTLQLTHSFITEMPWHFKQIQQNGNFPIVVTGSAWSHSHREDRQLSFILWEDNPRNINKQLLIWNPSKLNPVMPDAIILAK